jgi:hypothetical protein
VKRRHREPDTRARALADSTVEFDGAVVRFDNSPRKRQAQTEAARGAGAAPICTEEGAEDVR